MTAAALAVLALAGCVDLTTDPDEIVAIEFSPLPYPAVVLGDTLRDSLGVAAPLVGKLFNGSGDLATKPAPTFVSLDTIVDVTATGMLVAHQTVGTARLIATGGGLQSVSRSVETTLLPDTLSIEAGPDTLPLSIPDDAASNISTEFRLKLQSRAGGGVVRSWVVDFALRYRSQDIAPKDTSLLYLANEVGRPSAVDTTDGSGVVSRRLRFKVVAGQVPVLDSVIVVARAMYRGALVPGAPARMVVRVKPK
ncbi:MAG: hypothetical protein MNPFHGCM_01261 [Gemmatimonadaceae bacterium]|nr:hypothetical protein [Gemmatimonadaceae bacterium]